MHGYAIGRALSRGPLRKPYHKAYAACYGGLKAMFTLVCRPIFGVRRVGALPDMPETGVILCPNHASYLDPLFVQLVTPRRVTFVMTNDFYRKPWGRWFFRLVDAIPVGGWRLSRAGMRRAVAHLRRGQTVVIFPEGRLSRDGRLGKPKRGISRVAQRSGALVYPVAILGSDRAWPAGAKRPGFARVRVRFGEPLRYEGEADPETQQAFADEVQRRIAAEHAWIAEHAATPIDRPRAPTTG